MSELPKPVLSYEPVTDDQRRGRRRWLIACGMGIVAAVFVALLAMISLYRRSTATPIVQGQPIPIGTDGLSAHANAIGVPYGKWFLFHDKDTYVAIRITASIASQNEPISYEWIQSRPGRRRFEPVTSPAGKGSTFEVNGNGGIAAGPLKLSWSRGGPKNGWLYWSIKSNPNLKLSDKTYDDIPQLNNPRRGEKWYTPRGPFP